MAKNKLRKLARKIASQPKMKKELSSFIADYDDTYNTFSVEDLKEIRMNGHRGLLAMSENELTKRFDVIYEKLTKEVENTDPDEANSKGFSYQSQARISKLEKIKLMIARANNLYDDIFEEVFL